ncbi:Hsp70 family protein [Geminocystis sp. CENA526]|uniref:Hsp70 family protein n=1 Tax=Geminocystis sp. CENA526 TaxID=1355871 RepID=UPI003D6E8C60
MTTVAIDFGTSNTVVSIIEPDTKEAKSLRFEKMSKVFRMKLNNDSVSEIPVIPSLVFIKEGHEFILGEQVRTRRLGCSKPERFFKAFKRDLAAEYRSPARIIEGKEYPSETVAEIFLKEIWQQLKLQHLNPSQVIFTVPVGGFESYSNWCRDLATALGIEKVQLVDESTAAAFGYAVKKPNTLVLVVDFGGGTLDLSLVRTIASSSQVKELKGEVIAKTQAYVGGEDIDIWLIEDYLKKQGIAKKDLSNVAWQNLLEIAERIKIKLSHTEQAKESWLDEDTFIAYDIVFDRQQLTEILETQQLLPQLRNCLDEVIEMSIGKGINKKQIEKVVLVGGSCLIAPVRELITSYFGREKVLINKPFEAVSHGALTLNSLETIDDHLYHSYALRTWNPLTQEYVYNPLFRSGLQYPCELEHPLILQCANNGQDAIYLDIGQVVEMGKAELSYDRTGKMTSGIVKSQNTYKSLTYELDWQGNIVKSACIAQLNPVGTVGKDRLKIHLEIDSNRMLLVTVTDILTQEVLVYKKSIVHLY